MVIRWCCYYWPAVVLTAILKAFSWTVKGGDFMLSGMWVLLTGSNQKTGKISLNCNFIFPRNCRRFRQLLRPLISCLFFSNSVSFVCWLNFGSSVSFLSLFSESLVVFRPSRSSGLMCLSVAQIRFEFYYSFENSFLVFFVACNEPLFNKKVKKHE